VAEMFENFTIVLCFVQFVDHVYIIM